jgi:hypothetical protein
MSARLEAPASSGFVRGLRVLGGTSFVLKRILFTNAKQWL